MLYDFSSIKKFLSLKYIAISIILAVSVAVYLNTLSNGFVYDDGSQVVNNPWIKDIRFIPDIFLSHVWAFQGVGWVSNYYRPLMHIILMIDYYIFGLKPWGFHLTNIIFHAGVSVLVFLIASMLINHPARREERPSPPLTPFSGVTGGDKREGDEYSLLLPLIAAILFATHPIHTEVVAWVSGMPELSFTLFYLLSFYFYIKANGEYGKHLMLSILFFFLSTLCKETALTLPILLLAYDYSFKKDLHQRIEVGQGFSPALTPDRVIQGLKAGLPYRLIIRYLPYLIVSGIYFIIRTYAIGVFAPLKRYGELSSYEYLINIFPLFIQYLEKLILPINLNAFYVFHPLHSVWEWKAIVSIILTLTFISFVYVSRNIHRVVFFSLLWIVIPILPVLYIPALGDNTFAERYLYLQSVGFVMLASITITKILQFKVLKQTTVPIIISILIAMTGIYSIETIKRNHVWQDDYTLWVDTVKKSPDGPQPYNSLGLSYHNKGMIDKAIESYHIAIRLMPDYPEAHYNLGNAHYSKGQIDKAMEHYQIALKLKPDFPEAHTNMGNVYSDTGLLDKAIEHYQAALRIKPDFPESHINLGTAYHDKGWIDEAIEHYQIALKLRPDFPEVYYNLGNAYYSRGQVDKAIEHYQIALKLRPDFPEAKNTLREIWRNGAAESQRQE